ncbi:MAG: hypothetical protein HQM10_26425 [Candidatus Riflebacteria bacterium]|nr:hypothetical protein [Candidatus Riflebacteria bacterium]
MKRSCSRALSYIEILLAIIIMAGAMVPIASIIGYGFRHSSKDFRNLASIQLLQGTLSQVLAADYDRITTGNHTSPIDTGGSVIPLGLVASAGYNFNLRLSVTEISATFNYRPIRVDNANFVLDDPATWNFGPAETLNFNSANASSKNKYKVKQIVGEISWMEPEGASRNLKMQTYLAQLKD